MFPGGSEYLITEWEKILLGALSWPSGNVFGYKNPQSVVIQ